MNPKILLILALAGLLLLSGCFEESKEGIYNSKGTFLCDDYFRDGQRIELIDFQQSLYFCVYEDVYLSYATGDGAAYITCFGRESNINTLQSQFVIDKNIKIIKLSGNLRCRIQESRPDKKIVVSVSIEMPEVSEEPKRELKTCFWIGYNHHKDGIHNIGDPFIYEFMPDREWTKVELPLGVPSSDMAAQGFGFYFDYSEPQVTFIVTKEHPAFHTGNGFYGNLLSDQLAFMDLNANYFECGD